MLIDSIKPEYDVVIAGGGLVGGSFALMLQAMLGETSLRILLVDNTSLCVDNTDDVSRIFDARSTALSWGSRKIYEQADIWSNLAPHVTAIRNIHVSDKGHMGATRLHSTEMDVDALGYVAENSILNKVISSGLRGNTQLDVSAGSSVNEVKPVPCGVSLRIDRDNAESCTVNSRLIVIADGGRSSICEKLGIGIKRKTYDQQALICNIAFEKYHDGYAFERFTDTGPMAVLPLPDLKGEHRGALVWTLTEAEAPAIMALADSEFLAALQRRFGYRLGQITRAGERQLFPLSLNLAAEQIRPGIVLLGNVAHTLHPVAGQGLNLALRDARELADLIATTAEAGQYAQIGAYSWLQQYEKRQQADQQQTVMFSDLTTRLFSNTNPLLALGRNMGLLGMELLPPARHWFARQAMGMTDRRTRI
ncbi:MAG: 2-octaprenyl-6-methoxyphenyl hydroxylase [Pseudohongiella sp.]|nr:2-octaprenyl-6-methoxyphenyl hydroxylase [Pseudohongiella sp.]